MADSKVLAIGSIVKHRGEYNNNTVYYVNNQVTMCNCVFQAMGNDFKGIVPLSVSDNQTVQLANTEVWKCIIDNVALYNASLSTNRIENRTTVNEKNIQELQTQMKQKLDTQNIKVLSADEYNQLTEKDDNTFYFLYEDDAV